MDSALRELFYAYKHLPAGVMLFKNRNLFFVNDHLRNVLLLASLPTDHIIEIIGSMLGLENPSHHSLHDFLYHRDYFLYKNSIIQIEHRSANGINVFVLVKLSESAIQAIDATRPLRLLEKEKTNVTSPLKKAQWKLLTEALGPEFDSRKFPSIVLYKEIPIKADCRIINTKEGMIELSIAKRQLIATNIGKSWLLGIREDMMVSGKVASYDLKLGRIWLKDLKLVSSGFHLRSDIRYTIEDGGYFSTIINSEKKTLLLHDLSEKGLSIQTDDAEILLTYTSMIGKLLHAEVTAENLDIRVKAIPLYVMPLNSAGMMKVAFKIAYDSHNETLLHEWTNNEQLNLIRTIRNYVQMISGQRTDISD